MKLKVVQEPSDEGGYSIYVPTLSGCISEGDTRGEALGNIEEAIVLYLEPPDDDLSYEPECGNRRNCCMRNSCNFPESPSTTRATSWQ